MITKTYKTEDGNVHNVKSMETENYIVYVESFEINHFLGEKIVVQIYDKKEWKSVSKEFNERNFDSLDDAYKSAKQYIIDTIW